MYKLEDKSKFKTTHNVEESRLSHGTSSFLSLGIVWKSFAAGGQMQNDFKLSFVRQPSPFAACHL